jgi:hypothetical protein
MGTAVSSVQSAFLRSVTSGIRSANSHGPRFRRWLTSSNSRGVAAVRLATTSTRFFGCVSIANSFLSRIGVGGAKPTTQALTNHLAWASHFVGQPVSLYVKATNKEGGPKPNTVTMTGKFTDRGKKVSGTVSYEGAENGITCATGTLKYTAKLRPR